MTKIADRSYASGVSLRLGLVNIVGNLHTPKTRPKDEETVIVCPGDHEEPLQIPQFYVCDDHGNIAFGDTARAKEGDDGKLVKMTAEQVKEARKSQLPKNVMELKVHWRADAGERLIPSEVNYVFMPGQGSEVSYGLIKELIAEFPQYVFMGMVNLRDRDKLMQLDVGLNGQLILQEVCWPGDIKELPTPEVEVAGDRMTDLARGLIESLVEPFETDLYTKEARQRMAAAVVEARENPDGATSARLKSVPAMDLEAQLEATLAKAGVKPKKQARTRKAS